MYIITARQAARILGITTDALYRRVHNGEIPTVEAGEDLQPSTGHREYAFDRDVIAGMHLRPVGRPPTYAPNECERTALRVKARERRKWDAKARKLDLSISEWLRSLANAQAARPVFKLIVPKATPDNSVIVWVRSTKAEFRAWQVAAGRAKIGSTNRWLRYLANAAAE